MPREIILRLGLLIGLAIVLRSGADVALGEQVLKSAAATVP